jgi:MFS family permease
VNPSFAFFWCTRVASTLANQMFGVAVSWQIYDLTHSAFALGMIGLVQFGPTVLLMLIAGHVADRYERRYIACGCEVAAAVVGLTIAGMNLARGLSPTLLFVSILFIGVFRAFEIPSFNSLLPNIVPRDQLQRATANSTAASNVAMVAGPAIGGLLYIAGPAVVYASAAALVFIAALCILMTRPARREIHRAPQTLATLLAGVSFVSKDRVVLGAISLDLFAVLMGGATALLPIYARDIFATGPLGLGLLRSAPGAGALIMSLALGFFPLRRHVGYTLFATVAAYGAVTVVFALSHSFVLSLAALAAGGLFDTISRVIRATLVQLETPDNVRGRVTAVNSLFTNSSSQLGQLESGLVAAAIGAVPSAVVGGLGSILVAGAWLGLFPEIRRIDILEAPRPSAA